MDHCLGITGFAHSGGKIEDLFEEAFDLLFEVAERLVDIEVFVKGDFVADDGLGGIDPGVRDMGEMDQMKETILLWVAWSMVTGSGGSGESPEDPDLGTASS